MKLTCAIAAIAAATAFGLAPAAMAKEDGNTNHSQHASHGQPQHADQSGSTHGKRPKACPPGLAKKGNGCLPPGQWRKGDRLPESWISQYIRYGALPDFYRSRYDQNTRHRYLYRDGKVFVIDAVTHVILDIVLR